MKICFTCVEIFAWGKYGGFGRATRIIGRELVKRGIKVFAVVPRRKGQKRVERLDGITVMSFLPYYPWSSKKLYRICDADIYHSSEPSYGTYLAMKEMPDKKHIVTFRDPRDFQDWKMEYELPSLNRLQVIHNYFYENNFLVRSCINRMDGVYTIGKYLIPKVKSMYGLKFDPKFLPTPVSVPDKIEKASTPTVCFLARMDRRKRPEIFFELAKIFPHVKFIAVGKSRDKNWGNYLKKTYSHLSNLEMTGFVDQFSSILHSEILEKSWIMVNAATREALPNAFLEAAAHKCAILSAVDPDSFASQFGYHVKDNDFARGIKFLITNDRWREQGEKGYEYVKETFETDLAIDQHISVYNQVLHNQNF